MIFSISNNHAKLFIDSLPNAVIFGLNHQTSEYILMIKPFLFYNYGVVATIMPTASKPMIPTVYNDKHKMG